MRNLLNAIEERREISLDRFIYALGIRHVGETTALALARGYGSWKAFLDRAWEPGHYKRWYLRALQEEFDARLQPYGWSTPDFQTTAPWLPAMIMDGSPNKPALSTNYYEYMSDVGGGPAEAQLRPRSIPLLRES